jgi:hypothetical protein
MFLLRSCRPHWQVHLVCSPTSGVWTGEALRTEGQSFAIHEASSKLPIHQDLWDTRCVTFYADIFPIASFNEVIFSQLYQG